MNYNDLGLFSKIYFKQDWLVKQSN